MVPFILINIFVSAAVVLGILYWWDAQSSDEAELIPTRPLAIAQPTALVTIESVIESTDTPEPEEGPPLHVVSAGDTLGKLSEFYDVSMADIMSANDISDPNLIAVGQELTIPLGGLATETPVAATPEPDQQEPPTPIPTDTLPEDGEVDVRISSVTGAGELEGEAVQISNLGSRQIALLDWKLADADGHHYQFGQVTLFGDGAAIQIHTGAGQDGPADLYWGLEEPIWTSGERVTLLDAEESIVATFDIP
jgi:LysM repeat protein